MQPKTTQVRYKAVVTNKFAITPDNDLITGVTLEIKRDLFWFDPLMDAITTGNTDSITLPENGIQPGKFYTAVYVPLAYGSHGQVEEVEIKIMEVENEIDDI